MDTCRCKLEQEKGLHSLGPSGSLNKITGCSPSHELVSQKALPHWWALANASWSRRKGLLLSGLKWQHEPNQQRQAQRPSHEPVPQKALPKTGSCLQMQAGGGEGAFLCLGLWHHGPNHRRQPSNELLIRKPFSYLAHRNRQSSYMLPSEERGWHYEAQRTTLAPPWSKYRT